MHYHQSITAMCAQLLKCYFWPWAQVAHFGNLGIEEWLELCDL